MSKQHSLLGIIINLAVIIITAGREVLVVGM